MSIRAVIFGLLAILGIAYAARWITTEAKRSPTPPKPTWLELLIGFGTNFFDTLGIGSYAPTTALYKLTGIVPDERIPGTMNVGHTPPVIAQAFIFIAIVTVDPITIAVFIAAAVLGAWLGAGIVSRLPRRAIQLGLGIALVLAAGAFIMAIVGFVPAGGEALGLDPLRLTIAAVVAAILGALMTIGVGMYAPTMITVALLGMSPVAAFPMMMGASAFLMPVASFRFLWFGRYTPGAAVGLAIGGIPAVLIAAFIVKSLPLTVLRWLVVVVVLYTAVMMLRSAAKETSEKTGRMGGLDEAKQTGKAEDLSSE